MNEENKGKVSFNWKLVGHITHGYKRYLLISIISVIITILLGYATPLVTSYTIDFVIAGKDVELPGIVQWIVDLTGGR